MQKQARLIYAVRTVVTLGGNGDWKGTSMTGLKANKGHDLSSRF